MDKELFEGVMQGMEDMLSYAEGKHIEGMKTHHIEVPEQIDVRAIRTKLGMTQQQFADTFGFSIDGLSKWERHIRTPEKPARILLKMISKDPDAVIQLAT